MGKVNSGLMLKRKRIWKKEETKTVFTVFDGINLMWKMGKASSGLMLKRKRIWKKKETKTVFTVFDGIKMDQLDVENGKS